MERVTASLEIIIGRFSKHRHLRYTTVFCVDTLCWRYYLVSCFMLFPRSRIHCPRASAHAYQMASNTILICSSAFPGPRFWTHPPPMLTTWLCDCSSAPCASMSCQRCHANIAEGGTASYTCGLVEVRLIINVETGSRFDSRTFPMYSCFRILA